MEPADALVVDLEELAINRERAAEEERRADEKWRMLQEGQRLRNEAAEEEELRAKQAAAKLPRVRPPPPQASSSTAAPQQHIPQRGDDEYDGAGWTPRQQRALEVAMRTHPASAFESKKERWQAIAAAVPGQDARECVQRVRSVKITLKTHLPPPLLRLDADLLSSVLELLTGSELCIVAAVCKELTVAAHDDVLWLPLADTLPTKWAYSRRDREGEHCWSYTLRMRDGLWGMWRKLQEHRSGKCPYLRELGRVERGSFIPNGRLDYRVQYGVICELIQLETVKQEGLNHRVYKVVAEQLVTMSTNGRSGIPPDLHMTVREIYKTCYPGFGAGTGSGAFAPGLQAGGSSTKASTSGTMVGKGVATMTKKVQDEDMRKRLETRHEFFNLIPH